MIFKCSVCLTENSLSNVMKVSANIESVLHMELLSIIRTEETVLLEKWISTYWAIIFRSRYFIKIVIGVFSRFRSSKMCFLKDSSIINFRRPKCFPRKYFFSNGCHYLKFFENSFNIFYTSSCSGFGNISILII